MDAHTRLTGDVIDSRDLIERLNELEALEDSLDPTKDPEASGGGSLDENEREELDELRALADAGIEDWECGVTLIRENYFEEYAQELAEDVGAIDPNASWPLTYIDWEAAANALKQDYIDVQYDGSTYFVRT